MELKKTNKNKNSNSIAENIGELLRSSISQCEGKDTV